MKLSLLLCRFRGRNAGSDHAAVPRRLNPLAEILMAGAAALGLILPTTGSAQIVTNWVAFNDHAPSALTAPFVTAYNLRGMGLATTPTLALPTKGRLTNFVAGAYPAGQPLSAGLIVTALNTPNLFPNAGLADPFPGTPAFNVFSGIVDLANADSAIGLSAGEGDAVILTFTNLNPAMRYSFFGTAVRNGPTATVHPGRWSVSSISGAASFVSAHTPGVLTSATVGVPGLTLTNGQGVFQAGVNTNGLMVGWTEIVPSAAGTFSIITRGYSGPVTGGTFESVVTNAFDNLGYALCAFRIAEYGPTTGVAITAQPATSLALTQAQALTLSVKATGSSPTYQWFKTGVGAIAGATDSIFTIPSVAVSDAGSYYVEVSNGVNALTSSTSTVTVVQDNFAPKVVNIYVHPASDFITVEFDEPLSAGSEEVFNFVVLGPGDPMLTASVFGPNPKSVILTVDPSKPLQLDAPYQLTVSSVSDLQGNTIPALTPYPFRSTSTAGFNGLLFEAYRPITGNPITNLTGSPLFPNSPAETLRMTKFDSREIYPDDTHENYGGRIRGLFIPTVSGNYKFYLRSDDSSALYLNPSGPSAFGKIQVAEEVACCRTFLEDSPGVLASAAFPMTAGQGYYIEALYKEGGGGDFCQVAAKLETDPTEASTLLPLTGSLLGYPGTPSGVGGPVIITVAPTNTTVLENQPFVFTARGTNDNGLPIGYQWKRDGVNIPGATSQSYTSAVANFTADNGATFSVAVSTIGFETITPPVTLTVIPDTAPPTIVSITGNDYFDRITVVFNEPLNPATVDSFSFTINGGPAIIEIADAVLQADGRTVLITLLPSSKFAEATAYTLVAEVTDLKGNPYAAGPSAFNSFKMAPGFLNFSVFDTGGGNDVSILTSHPSFPHSPRERLFVTSFDSRSAYPDDSHDAYGGRISGLFIPPTTGNWIFYLRSDDGGELFLNPFGTDPAGKISLTAEPACCNPFSAHASAPQALTAGVPVYIEALYKEGAGGDVCQVAAKLETDPTPADVLKPIPGAYLAAYAPFEGASVTITNQPVSQTAAVSLPARTVALTSFTAGNGGYKVSNLNGPGAPWAYNAVSGAWACNDQDGCVPAPRSSRLTSPTFTVTTPGTITVTFAHRYSFEDDGTTRWDGGQVRISVNRGAYLAVPLASFSAGGYNATVGGSAVPNTEITGQDAFTGTSAGHAAATYITSTATLGTFAAGDLVSIQFLAAWDDCSQGALPNWEIKSVEVSPALENREADAPVTLIAGAFATASFTTNPPIAFQWQKLVGGTFTNIADATSATYTFLPTTDEDASLFRCVVLSIGDSETTTEATVRLAPAITLEPLTGSLVIKWPASLTGYTVESAAAFASPPSTTIWGPAAGTPGSAGGFNTLTVPTGTGQTFFRLKKP